LFFLIFRKGKEFWYLCIRRHSLKFTVCKTRELTGVFVSFFQLSAGQHKEKWQNRWKIYNLGYIFAHKEGVGFKVLTFIYNLKSENNSYVTICRIIVPNTFCTQTRYTLPLPPLMCKYIAQICQWPHAVRCCDEFLVIVVELNIINILITNIKLLKTSVPARKYYGFNQFFMWRCSGGIIWGLFLGVLVSGK